MTPYFTFAGMPGGNELLTPSALAFTGLPFGSLSGARMTVASLRLGIVYVWPPR